MGMVATRLWKKILGIALTGALLVFAGFLISLLLNNGATARAAQKNYPAHPITYLDPFNPGGVNDIVMRRQQPYFEKLLGTQVEIEYRAGGGGSVAWSTLVHSRPDGYTMASINIPHIILQPIARKNAGYRTEQIIPVAFVSATPNGIAVRKDSPFKTLKDLINYARKHPGAITISGTGTFTGHHIATLQFEALTGVKLTYVPFTGSAPQMAALLGKHVMATFGNSSEFVQHLDKVRVLGIGTKTRMKALPDAPTFEEQGIKMYPSIERGVGFPPGTPMYIVKKLEKVVLETAAKVRSAEIKDGFQPMSMGHDESVKHIKELQVQYKALLKKVKH